MAHPSLRLFGPFHASLGKDPINFRTSKVQALLIYLVAGASRQHPREALMTLRWPELPLESAQVNLRQIVYQLRKAIPDSDSHATGDRVAFLLSGRQSIELNPDAVVAVDVAEFARLVAEVATHAHSDLLDCLDCRSRLEAATRLYRGAFLAEFYLEDSNAFEDWAQRHREVYRRQQMDALSTLGQMELRQTNYKTAASYATQQLAIDNLDERAYRQLMEALARNGQRNEALAVYEEAQRLLRDELAMAPAQSTTRLAEKIRMDTIEAALPPPSSARGYQLLEQLSTDDLGEVLLAFQPVVGREVVIKIIHARYANRPDFIRRFAAEAQTIAQLEHPHIVPLYDYWREPGSAYLVMRRLRGGSLDQLLAGGALELDAAVRMVDQLAGALHAAHRQQIIHGNVKVTNILLDEEANAYLSDFRVAADVVANQPAGDMVAARDSSAPESLRRQTLSPLSDQYNLGMVAYQMLTGCSPFPPGLRAEQLREFILTQPLPAIAPAHPGIPPEVDQVIQRATAKDPHDRFPDIAAMAMAFRQAAQTGNAHGYQDYTLPQTATDDLVVVNPYKGLRAFQEGDSDTFFGREALVAELVARLTETNGVEQLAARFLAIVGPSGSGKSSVVKAGLIPALRRSVAAGADRWFVIEMTPGSEPFKKLEQALTGVAVDLPADLLGTLNFDPEGLARVLRRVLPPEDDGQLPQLLLVVDQFEELFTLVEDPAVRARFIESLMTALNQPDSQLRVLTTVRADFYDRPLQVPALADLLRTRTEVVPPMSRSEFEQAMSHPARLNGITLEPRLLAAMMADAADQPGVLPLMQYALTELFERRHNGQMTVDAYETIGGLVGALGRRADEIFNSLSANEQEAARQMFLRLVTLGEGVEDTRRRVLRAELEAVTLADADMSMVIDAFGRYRLLTFDRDPETRGPTVEVAHEALLREWPQLRLWLDESRANIRLQRLLAVETAAWISAARSPGYLLRGSRLDQFEGWADESNVRLTTEEADYLTASLVAREQRLSEEEARRQRELETIRQLAETERQRAQEQTTSVAKLRQRALLLAGAFVVAGVLAAAAIGFARSSNQNAVVAATRAVEANANAALAVENANLAATRQAEAGANAALATTREAEAIGEANIRATTESLADAQRDVAVANERKAVESYSLALAANARQALEADDEPLALLLALAANTVDSPPLEAWRTLLDVAYAPGAIRKFQVGSPVNTVAISPDGETVLSGSNDGLIRQWDIGSGALLQTMEGHTDAVGQVVLSEDGAMALSGGWDHKAILWNVDSGTVEKELIGHSSAVHAVAFLPDGKRALTGEDSGQLQGELILWDLGSGEILNRFGGDLQEVIEGVRSIAISPDGQTALVGYGKISEFDTQPAALWDIDRGEVIHFLDGPDSSINSVDISPDGRLGFGAADDGNVYVWDLASGEMVQTLHGNESAITNVTISPDGLTALTGALDGRLTLWDLANQQPVETFKDHQDAIWGLGFQQDGSAVSGSADGTLRWWDLSGHWRLDRWQDPAAAPGDMLEELHISPDGRLVLTESLPEDPDRPPGLTLYDYASGTPIRRLEPVGRHVDDIAFTPDNLHALTADFDGALSLWDLESGQIERRFEGHNGYVRALDISSDGRFAVSAGGIDGQVIYRDLVTGEIIWRMTGHFEGRGLLDVVFVPGNRQAVSSSWDGTLILWDLATGEQIRRLNGLSGGQGGHLIATGQTGAAVNQIAAFEDGRHVLSTGNDRSLLLWDLVTGESLLRLKGHTQPVLTVGLTPDGKQALSGAFDDPLILWDLETGQSVRHFQYRRSAKGGFAPLIAVHPSGQSALTSEVDGSIIKWQISEPGAIELIDWIASNRVVRELTCLERDTYQIEPLCVDDAAVAASADMLTIARQAVGSLVTAPAADTIVSEGTELTLPERVPRTAVLGENRGEITRGNFDVWLYDGTAGEVLTMHMAADHPLTDPTIPLEEQYESGVLDTKLFLVNPDGTILALIDDEITTDLTRLSDARIEAVRLPVDGQYRIEARSKLEDHAGGYTLTIEQLNPIWNADLFAEYEGYYVEGPWQYGTYIFVDGDRLMQVFDFAGEQPYEQVPISENDFISGGGGHTVFTYDENGKVNGYKLLLPSIHFVSGQWYYAERVGDLPPGFVESHRETTP